jgi:hypothetical protein
MGPFSLKDLLGGDEGADAEQTGLIAFLFFSF